MQLVTIVEDYVYAAMKRAIVEEMENGTVVATVPGCPGIVASGADRRECAIDLFRRLEDWVQLWLRRGYQLPAFDGIDVNTTEARELAGQSPTQPEPGAGVLFFRDEDELEAALAQ